MNDLMTRSFFDYVELKKQALRDLEAGPDVEMAGLSHEDNENLRHFFEEVGAIKTEIEGINHLLLNLQALNEETKSTHSVKLLRGLRDQMDSDMLTILRKAKVMKTRLGALDRANVADRTIPPAYEEGSPIDRTRISVTNGLRIRLRDLMNEFQSLRERIVAEHKANLKRRYFNATGKEASDATIEKLMSAGDQIEAFEQKAELNLENQERHEAVKQIQKSLTKLHQLFLDMAVLVDAQGEQMDDIEYNVIHAGNYLGDGTQQLAAANDMNNKKGRCHRWIWVLIVILILVGLVLILVSSSI